MSRQRLARVVMVVAMVIALICGPLLVAGAIISERQPPDDVLLQYISSGLFILTPLAFAAAIVSSLLWQGGMWVWGLGWIDHTTHPRAYYASLIGILAPMAIMMVMGVLMAMHAVPSSSTKDGQGHSTDSVPASGKDLEKTP